MGSKGQSTSNTQQQSTYNPAGASYIQSALQQGQAAAQTPFQQPVAPVAGFSQDQQSAFNTINNAQGMAQPYINQAAQDFTPQGTQAFLNPYASNVMAQMQNQFGEQQQQATGQLTQAAGGVGADRIAVGQADLANQQSLAAGQTMSNLYGQAAQQAQSAGYATAGLGSQAQNAALQGAQAQLGSGGLQQQLQQAQLNAPYQQQLAQLAYPFQTAQFNAGITGALAPGLGGTTSGFGGTQSQAAPPSIYSQILGLGAAGAGFAGGMGAFGGTNSGTGKGGTSGTGIGATSMNGQLSNPMSIPGYQSAARGGRIYPYARGGDVGYDDGGSTDSAGLPGSPFSQIPTGMDNQPINVAPKSIVPAEQLTPIKANIPQINLNPPQQSQGSGSSSGDLSSVIGTAAKIGAMFIKRGGRVNNGFDVGGDTDVVNPDAPYRMPDAAAVDAWRSGVDTDKASGITEQPSLPSAITAGMSKPPPDQPYQALSFADGAGKPAGGSATTAATDYTTPTNTPVDPPRDPGFAGSPWAALMQAGLAVAGGTSPYAGVNIGKGGLEGLKTLEAQREAAQKDTTINQAAKRLQMEADHHVDAMKQADRPYKELTKEQSVANQRQQDRDDLAERQFNRPYEELTKQQQAQLEETRRQNDLAHIPPGYRGTPTGQEFVPGGPHDPASIQKEAEAKRLPAMSREDMEPLVDAWMTGDHSVMSGIGRGTQGPQNIQQMWNMIAERLRNQGTDGKTLAAARANFLAESAAAKSAAVREQNVQSSVNEAKLTFPLLLQRSSELPRTDYPVANKALEFFRSNTGSPEQRRYGAALQAVITAYSQAMSRTGANSVHAQQHAEELLHGVDGHEALKATVEQLDAEMEIARLAPEQTREGILNRILGVKEGAKAAPPGGTPAGGGAAKPTLAEFLAKAKAANPGKSDADLTAYYNQNYGGQ